MSGQWSRLRESYKARDRDLDAEFEKFLNEVSCSHIARQKKKNKVTPEKKIFTFY